MLKERSLRLRSRLFAQWFALAASLAAAGLWCVHWATGPLNARASRVQHDLPRHAGADMPLEQGASAAAQADQHSDWPNLFGPAHDNRSRDPIHVDWADGGPPELWRMPIGSGYSSPIVTDERVIVLHRLADEELVSCLDAASGEALWEFRYPTSFVCGSHYTSGPYSTPASNGDRVVALGAQGELHCLDLRTGEIEWQLDTRAQFDVRSDIFGAGHSPLIWRDLVILNIGGEQPNSGIVAFDLASGQIRWRATDHGPSYATPVPATMHGRARLFVLTREGLVLLDPEDGRVLSEYPYSSSVPDGYNAVTPIVWEDLVLISVFGEGSVCLQVQPDDSLLELWQDRRTLTSQYNPILAAEGYAYGLHAVDKSFRCIDLATGELQWRWKSDLARSTHLIAGSHILLFGEFGELGAIDLNPEACLERAVTSQSLFDGERCFSAPALGRGRLYLRNEHEILCLDVAPPPR